MNKRQKIENKNEFSLIPYYLIRHIYTNFDYRIDKLIHTFVGFTPRNNDELRNAVIEWIKFKINAENLFGHISFWNTQLITNMEELFCECSSFNENIGRWNVSNGSWADTLESTGEIERVNAQYLGDCFPLDPADCELWVAYGENYLRRFNANNMTLLGSWDDVEGRIRGMVDKN